MQARHLHQNTVGALALDQRLDGAEFVDAALDDLDRLLDRLAHALEQRRIGDGQPDQMLPSEVDIEASLAIAAEDAAERHRQLAQLGQRLLAVGVVADAHFDAVAAHGQAGIADAGVAQNAAHVIAGRLKLFLAHRVGVDLQQDMRTALQVEAEHDVALRPFRPARTTLSGRKFGTANRQTINAVRMIATAFHRVK